jgi:DNA-directed RNA polymerase specialized sigma24 family protein
MAKEQPITEKKARVSRRRPVSSESFALLLAALGDTAKEQGIQYERLRSKLIFFFSRKLLPFPEDLADEVLDRLTHRISGGVLIASVPAFALGIARHVAQEQSGQKNPHQTMEEAFWDNVPAHLPTQNNEEKIVRMERCLKSLPRAESKLLRDYYLTLTAHPMQARQNLAESLGISANTLRQRVFLARQSLRACMTAVDRKKGR